MCWHAENDATDEDQDGDPPFGSIMADVDFENLLAVKIHAYTLLAHLYPDAALPFTVYDVPPWYRRLWHVLSGKPFHAGYVWGKAQEIRIHEPLPLQPPTDWFDAPSFERALQLDLDELRRHVARSAGPMFDYALAIRLHTGNDISEALSHLDGCLQQLPDVSYLNCLRAEWSLQDSQTERGLFYSEKAVTLAPEFFVPYFVRGSVYASLHAWEQAEADYLRVTELFPAHTEGWLRLAQVRANRQRTDEALQAIDQALDWDPYHPHALAIRIDWLPFQARTPEQAEDIRRRVSADIDTALKYCAPNPFFLIRRAEQRLYEGRSMETIALCDEALSLDEANANALGIRGAAHLTTGDIPQATLDLDRAIELGIEAPAVLEARGRIHLASEELDLARLQCERAIALDDQFPVSYVTLASALAALGQSDGAFEALDQAQRLAPTWDAPLRIRGDLHLQLEDAEKAYPCYSRAVKLNPQLASNWLQRAICDAQRGRFEEALRDANAAIEREGGLAQAHRFKAFLLLTRHDHRDAAESLSEVLRLEPDDVASRLQRAHCYLAQQRPLDARQDFDRVIEQCPDLAPAYSGRGRSWIQTGHEDQAAADFREAAFHDPVHADDFEITRLLAEAAQLQHADDYASTLGRIAEALEINPESEPALAMRTLCYWHDEQFVEAIEDFNTLLEHLSHDEDDKFKRLACLNNRGQVYVEIGEYQLGLSDLETAVELAEAFGNNECLAYSLSGRALALAGLNEIEKAEIDFRKSVATRPENAWVYYNQGLVYDKLGRPRDAAICFDLALALEEPPLPARKRQRARAYVARHPASDEAP